MALAHPRTSAPVIPLPGALVAPIVNQPHTSGRYAKGITPISRGKVLRRARLESEQQAAPRAPLQWPLPAANPALWPFGFVRRDQFETLSATDRAEIEGYILGRVISRQEARHV